MIPVGEHLSLKEEDADMSDSEGGDNKRPAKGETSKAMGTKQIDSVTHTLIVRAWSYVVQVQARKDKQLIGSCLVNYKREGASSVCLKGNTLINTCRRFFGLILHTLSSADSGLLITY